MNFILEYLGLHERYVLQEILSFSLYKLYKMLYNERKADVITGSKIYYKQRTNDVTKYKAQLPEY